MMEYEISLHNLKFYSFHGVYDFEREEGNEFRVDLSVKFPCNEETALNDDLNDTVSYADLFEIVKKSMAIPKKLLETVAFEIISEIKKNWDTVISGKIRIEKTRPPIAGMLGSASVSLIF